nr:uncharacterized protein LOC111513886 [Leptinotarsa decemlineata]
MSAKKYCKYSQDNLLSALEAIKHGMPRATAAKKFNVPRTTLIGKIDGRYPEICQSGASTVLTSEEENILVQWILNMARMGFPVTKLQLMDSVSLLVKNLKRPNKFNNGHPGRHWYEGFLQRHPEISQRMAQNLTASRAAVTKIKIQNWFGEISDYFTSSNIDIRDPERIFNSDESAFFLSPKGNSVLAKKGSKTVYDRSGNDKECLTVLITGNAAGQLAPPMVMYPYERIPKHIAMQIPSGWGVGKSETGWMTSESFFEYITNIFFPWLVSKKLEFPILLYVDGHKSHITFPLSDFCRKKGIILISLLPNSTHILQPLDVGLFKALKNSWKNKIRNYRTQNNFKTLNREYFAPVLKTALDDMKNLKTIFENAFKVCGLHPFDIENVDLSKVLQSTIIPENETNQPTENSDIVKNLRFLEQHIEKETVQKFYLLRGANWTGNVEDKTLYSVWKQIFIKSGLSFPIEEESGENIIIEVKDGIYLEEDWDNMILNLAGDINMTMTEDHETNNDIPDLQTTDYNQFSYDGIEHNIQEASEKTEKSRNPQNLGSKAEIRILQNISIVTEGNDIADEIFSGMNDDSKEINNDDIEKKKNVTTDGEKEKTIAEINMQEEQNTIKNDIFKNKEDIAEGKVTEEAIVESTPEEEILENNIEEKNGSTGTTQFHTGERIILNDIQVTPEDKKGNQATLRKTKETERKSPENVTNTIFPEIVIPSPFKKALFWPEATTSKKPVKNKKEKIPSVTTSDAWKEYYLKKEGKKEKQMEEKENRKRKREEKKNTPKPKNTRRQLHIKKNNNESSCIDKPNENEKASTSGDCGKSNFSVDDFVIVNYEGKYYPGVIKNIADGKAFISTMTTSSLRQWKWPEGKDEIWYEFHEIIEKIKKPKQVNKRGFFEVEEVNKYSQGILE